MNHVNTTYQMTVWDCFKCFLALTILLAAAGGVLWSATTFVSWKLAAGIVVVFWVWSVSKSPDAYLNTQSTSYHPPSYVEDELARVPSYFDPTTGFYTSTPTVDTIPIGS